jgi:hypothetical protein
MSNLEVTEVSYMEGEPSVWYSVVDRSVTDRTHVVATFLDKAEADDYVARKRASAEPREEPLPPGCIRVVVCAGCGQHDTMGAYHLDMCPAFSGPIRPKSA